MFALPRIDVLIHQAPRELLGAAVELALHERLGNVDRDARRELLHQIAAEISVGFGFRLALEILQHALAQRLQRLEIADVLRKLVVQRRQDALAEVLHRY